MKVTPDCISIKKTIKIEQLSQLDQSAREKHKQVDRLEWQIASQFPTEEIYFSLGANEMVRESLIQQYQCEICEEVIEGYSWFIDFIDLLTE